jgi:hypothetical protein
MIAATATSTGLPHPPTAKAAGASVDTIRTLLHNEIADILHAHLPSLALVPKDKVYDHVLDDPIVCEQAFRLLRTRPELFQDVVITPEKMFPDSDGDVLWCGRTLAEAIALVVRACARRYFKRRLRTIRPKSVTPQPTGLWRGIGMALGLVGPAPHVRKKGVPSPGDRLFQAMRDLLLYDWQVPLIPAYAALSPQLVTALGPKLLDYRDPLRLQLLADQSTATALVEGKVPLLLSNAQRLISANSDSINAEVLWNVCQKMRMAALFPGFDTNEMRKAVSMIAATSPKALQLFMPVLGGDIRPFTLYLVTAYGKFGPTRYRQVFGNEGQGWVLESMARRVTKGPALGGTHEEMKANIELWLDSAVEQLDRADAQKAETHQQLDRMKA